MEPTTEKEDGGEARGSRLRRRRWAPLCPTPPAVTTRSRATQSESAPPSQGGKRKRSRASYSRGRKKARATGREDEKNAEQQEEAAAAASASSPADHAATDREDERNAEEEEAASASPPAEHASSGAKATSREDEKNATASPPADNASSGASSVVSSPLRWPELPRAVIKKTAFGDTIYDPFHEIDPAIVRAHSKLVKKYVAKKDRQLKLVSLDQRIPRSCMVDLSLLSIRESATKSILQIAKAVVGLSSYIDGKLLRRTSGFLVDWDAEHTTGIVLTSAFVIQSKSSSPDQWLATDKYAPHAEVRVHLMDKTDTTLGADLLHYDKQYNLALLKISRDLSAQIPSFTSELKFAEEVFVLGRDECRNLIIDHGNVDYQGPSSLQRHHYMFTTCGPNKLAIGGPVINHAGQVAGMFILPGMAFIPSSIILKCLQMWKVFNCIPRLHVGMKFSAISFLDVPHREKIACKCDVDDGLIVTKVSEGSIAEKIGVRHGDIIKSWNGKNIFTTIELENFMLDMCAKHLDNGNSIGSSMDLSIGIFHMRKGSYDTIKMTVNVSDDVEVFANGIYSVTATDCTAVDDDDDDDNGLIQGEASDDDDLDIESYPV